MTGNNGVRTCLFLIFLQEKKQTKDNNRFLREEGFYEFGMGPNTFLSAKKWQRQLKPNVAIRE
jgi:non-ribosomal peptide synthetase component E (peptide arylation enzyme)